MHGIQANGKNNNKKAVYMFKITKNTRHRGSVTYFEGKYSQHSVYA